MSQRKRMCVFCGARHSNNPIYEAETRKFAAVLADEGWDLVYGGGNVGLMGTIADAMLEAGCEVIGVIPKALVEFELAHGAVTQLHVVETMHERKALMADFADAFVALPGAYGTMDEFCEILTWAQLGIHDKPCGMLNIGGYFDHFIRFLEHALNEGYLTPINRKLFVHDDNPTALLDRMREYVPPQQTPFRSKGIR